MQAPRTTSRAAFGFVFVSALLSAVSFSIVIPVLPELVRSLSGGDRARAAEWMMLLASAWGLTQFVFSPLLGALADRYGRRPVLLLSSLGLALDFLLMALAPSLLMFLVGRLVSGATAASFSAARAYVADITPEEGRAGAFGKLAAALSVGFMVGPALGGWFGEGDLRLPFFIAAGLCAANFVYGLLVLPESLPAERRAATLSWSPFQGRRGVGLLKAEPRLAGLIAVSFLNSLSNMIWGSVWVLFCGHRFGWSPAQMGLQILAAGLLGFAVQVWLTGPLVKRLGGYRALLLGLTVSTTSLVWAGLSPNGWWFAASMPWAALGLILGPALQVLLSAEAAPEQQGRLQGATQSLHGLATIIGPPIYGALFAWSLRQDGGLDLSGLVLMLSAAFLAVGIVVSVSAFAPRTTASRLSAAEPP
jgi:DHA1 family tetracycline resistance protein-like MFS transporter